MRKNERRNLTTLVKSARLFQRSLIEWLDTYGRKGKSKSKIFFLSEGKGYGRIKLAGFNVTKKFRKS